MNRLEKRVERIEQKIGSDTIEIRGIGDLVRYVANLRQSIKPNKVSFEPKLAAVLKQAARAYREDKDNEQEH